MDMEQSQRRDIDTTLNDRLTLAIDEENESVSPFVAEPTDFVGNNWFKQGDNIVKLNLAEQDSIVFTSDALTELLHKDITNIIVCFDYEISNVNMNYPILSNFSLTCMEMTNYFLVENILTTQGHIEQSCSLFNFSANVVNTSMVEQGFKVGINFTGVKSNATIKLSNVKVKFEFRNKLQDEIDAVINRANSQGKLVTEITSETSGDVTIYTIHFNDDSSYNITSGSSGGSVDIVTAWNTTTSDEKVPSEKLTKTSLDDKISKSDTTGLVKNDGSIMASGTGSNNWAVGNHTHSTYVQKSNTSGLLKNDGTVDTTTYQTTSNIVTSFSSDTSDSKYPSEKLVKTELDKKIATSSTNGLVKNDGSIDTTSYSTFSGSYNDLSNKPTIPLQNVWYGTCSTGASTQTKVVTVSDWSFTTGNMLFVKFSNGNSYNGTAILKIGDVSTNVVSVGTTTTSRYYWKSGELVGFVYDGTNFTMLEKAPATTTYYGITKLSDSVTSTSTSLSATPNSVKQAYDLANSKADAVHTHITTDITDFPSLSTVATSGSYTDLSNKPSIPSSSSDLSDGSSLIKTSNTSGLIKNDGTIDTNSYSTTTHTHGNLNNNGTITNADTSVNYTYFVGLDSNNAMRKCSKLKADQIIDNTAHSNLGTSANATQKAINTAIDTALANVSGGFHTHQQLQFNFVYNNGTSAKSLVTEITGTIGEHTVTLSDFTETNSGYAISKVCDCSVTTISLNFAYDTSSGYTPNVNTYTATIYPYEAVKTSTISIIFTSNPTPLSLDDII